MKGRWKDGIVLLLLIKSLKTENVLLMPAYFFLLLLCMQDVRLLTS